MTILTGWTPRERHAVLAAYLGWALDAFDFFVLVFVLKDVAASFDVPVSGVAWALTLTLAFRPLGAFIFGRLADRYGRRPVLMVNVALYSLFGFLTAFAPSLTMLYAVRSLFGVAMGGVWGIGASLAFETVKSDKRGFVSGQFGDGNFATTNQKSADASEAGGLVFNNGGSNTSSSLQFGTDNTVTTNQNAKAGSTGLGAINTSATVQAGYDNTATVTQGGQIFNNGVAADETNASFIGQFGAERSKHFSLSSRISLVFRVFFGNPDMRQMHCRQCFGAGTLLDSALNRQVRRFGAELGLTAGVI